MEFTLSQIIVYSHGKKKACQFKLILDGYQLMLYNFFSNALVIFFFIVSIKIFGLLLFLMIQSISLTFDVDIFLLCVCDDLNVFFANLVINLFSEPWGNRICLFLNDLDVMIHLLGDQAHLFGICQYLLHMIYFVFWVLLGLFAFLEIRDLW